MTPKQENLLRTILHDAYKGVQDAEECLHTVIQLALESGMSDKDIADGLPVSHSAVYRWVN